jgi:hypothetical protein
VRTELLLQMNTEGHEYDVLLGLSEAVAKRQRASPTSPPTSGSRQHRATAVAMARILRMAELIRRGPTLQRTDVRRARS